MGNKSLKNKKREAFCQEFLVDRNATNAAIRAEYSEKTAKVQGSRLLTFVDVRKRVDFLTAERSKRTEITADRVLEELAKLAFGSVENLYDKNGRLLDVNELGSDVAATIQEVTEDSIGKGPENVIRRKYKTASKQAALESLGKHLKLFTEKSEVSGPNGGPVQQEVQVTFVRPGDVLQKESIK